MGYDDLKKRGAWMGGIFKVLEEAIENWNAFLVKLDVDIPGTYHNNLSVASPTIGNESRRALSGRALPLGDLVQICKSLRTNYNTAMDDLAADGGVAGTTIFTNTKFAATANLIDESNARMKKHGAYLDAIVDFLDQFVDKFNDALDACDADATLSDTDYFSLYGITDVVEASSSSSS